MFALRVGGGGGKVYGRSKPLPCGNVEILDIEGTDSRGRLSLQACLRSKHFKTPKVSFQETHRVSFQAFAKRMHFKTALPSFPVPTSE